MSDLLGLVSDEINFHNDVEEPFYIRWYLHLLGRKTPKEVVLYELNFLKFYGGASKEIGRDEIKKELKLWQDAALEDAKHSDEDRI